MEDSNLTTTESFLDTNATNSTPPAAFTCNDAQIIEYIAVLLHLPIAIILVVALSFLTKRKTINKTCCHGGRPGLMEPMDFTDYRGRRWAYSLVFVLMTYRVLNLFEGRYYFKPAAYSDPEFDSKFGWSLVFVNMLNICLICVVFYPLLACISLRHSISANITGFIYLLAWVFWSAIIWVSCPLYPGDAVLEGTDGLGDQMFLLDLPILAAFIGLVYCYVADFVCNIRKRCCHKVKPTGFSDTNAQALEYIHKIIATKPIDESINIVGKMKKKAKYRWIPGVYYSPRLMCTMAVSALAIYKASAVTIVGFTTLYNHLHSIKEAIDDALDEYDKTGDSSGVQFIVELMNTLGFSASTASADIRHFVFVVWDWVYITFIVLVVSLVVSTLVQLFSMVLVFLNYRKDLLKLFKGNYSWQPKMIEKSSAASALFGSMKYSGFQIAFFIYAWFLLSVILVVVLMLVCYLVIVPIRDKESNFVLRMLYKLWPTVIVTVALNFAQLMLCKFCFLQQNGAFMALTNRRAMNIASYFLFFFNVLLGLFSCLRRILFSVLIGTILISRLDRLLLTKGFERLDTGYSTYLGMLKVDLYHTHPILKAFVDIVIEHRREVTEAPATVIHSKDTADKTQPMTRKRIARNRWRKALTLVNNPTILLDRLQVQIKEQEKKRSKGAIIADGFVGGVVTGVTLATAAVGASAKYHSIYHMSGCHYS
ncbi:hypothetical protein CAPTEDRAFT_225028 [Capitella teleta]|uniref:Receptor for retinol uptake STRA6 n=1 Tax=Capitella teleta TaxID=283909 RepID=R7UPT0_CAPTE|nr:hypothetical protein CAPTEDRAFT_225028 [Capitella teleta]|eukprot:ELU08524.1 hypothetical protein CAPTEDRAFT_225028 [Capitella teleta]